MPTVIAARQYGCAALALDETRVYWSTQRPDPSAADTPEESDVVRSCEKNNCAATVVTYATSQPYVRDLVVDRTRVYWIGLPVHPSNSCIVACPIRGCDGPPTVIVQDVEAMGLVVDDLHVYWLSPGAGLLRCSLQGCQGPPMLVAATEVPYRTEGPGSISVDNTDVYWITRDPHPSELGSLMAVPKDGSLPPRAMVAGVHLPRQLAIGDGTIFWTEESMGGTVQSCPLTGCASEPVLIASQQAYPQSLAVGRESAYWLTSLDLGPLSFFAGGWRGQLVECAITGCGASPSVLATEEGGPRAVAVDATHVYWTTHSEHTSSAGGFDGAVKRMRRRP
jgi:hypothetical protein